MEAPGTGPQTDTGGSVMEDPPAAVVDSGSVEVGEDAQVGPADTLDADVDSSVADSSAPAPDAGSVLPTVDAAQAQDAALMDAQDALVTDADGSQEDAAQDAGPVVDATPGQDAGPRCTLDGSFAAEVNFAVQWKGTTLGGVIPVLAAGTGHLRIMVRIDAQQTGAQPSWKLTACGAVIPDFAASWLIGEVYSVEIPAKAWDQPTNPGWPLQWNLDCNGPGCGLRSAPFLATLGARYQAPTDWPGASGPLSQIVSVDHDSDMHPGITLRARGPREQNPAGKAYDLPPVSWNLGARATTIYTALQIATRIEGALDSCDAFKGTLHDGRVEARALGCTARKDGEPRDEPCTTPQATFVDTNFPNWVVTGGTLRAKRIAPESTCAGVRAALQ
ncbi:MAG TPA: hypothetical protein VFZ61_04765 [Polyangiales bacterium]